MKMKTKLIGAMAFALAATALGQAATAFQGSPSAAARPMTITAEQAARGQQVYQEQCQGCHGGGLSGGHGGPPLNDVAFRSRWRFQPGDALFSYIRKQMPPNAGGALSDQAYADVTARVLEANGVKPGGEPLTADPARLSALSLTAALPRELASETGPKPLPVALPPDAIATATAEQRAEQLRKLSSVTDEMLRKPPAGEWLQWRSGYESQGFSALDWVNRDNVGRLAPAWSWKLGAGTNEVAPLVHDGVMFVVGGGKIQAIDAVSGDLLWQYARADATSVVRTIALYGDLVYFSAGVEVHAVDFRTGKLVWKTQLVDPKEGLYISAGPLAAKGKIFQGVSGCSAPHLGGCFIAALDARTGREVWRFRTIARPGEPGGDSWNGAPADQRFGASVWIPGSYDPDLDLVFFGTGQTYHTAPLLQAARAPGAADALYTDTTLALRPDTGELVWHYQHLTHDVWDLDWSFERTLATLTINGKSRRTVTTMGKLGIADTLDAATGQYLRSFDSGIQTLVAAIDPKTGAKTTVPALKAEAHVEKFVCPSAFGGRNWPATALDPRTGTLFVPLNETCMNINWTPGPVFDMAFHTTPRPNSDGLFGRVSAIDLATGKTLWSRRQRAPQTSAILATAGGVIFEGTRDRWFRASDARTGKILWQTRLDGAINSYPMTYSVDGVQYVAVVTGGTAATEMFWAPLTPEIQTNTLGTTVWVFRVPKP